MLVMFVKVIYHGFFQRMYFFLFLGWGKNICTYNPCSLYIINFISIIQMHVIIIYGKSTNLHTYAFHLAML